MGLPSLLLVSFAEGKLEPAGALAQALAGHFCQAEAENPLA